MKKILFQLFRFEIMRILMEADLVLQIGWVPNFFLWKYLVLSQFLILKTPTELPYDAISLEISFHSTCMSTNSTFHCLISSWQVSFGSYCFWDLRPKSESRKFRTVPKMIAVLWISHYSVPEIWYLKIEKRNRLSAWNTRTRTVCLNSFFISFFFQ